MTQLKPILKLSKETEKIICNRIGVSNIEELDDREFGPFEGGRIRRSAVEKIFDSIQRLFRGNLNLPDNKMSDSFDSDKEFEEAVAIELP